MKEMLASHQEEQGRNDWRKHMNERDAAYEVIDKAFEFIEKNCLAVNEIATLKKILDEIDTGRESRKKWAKTKKALRDAFAKDSIFYETEDD
jgi:hypothetical protein